MAFEYIAEQIALRKEEALLRTRVCFDDVSARALRHQGKSYLNFASNDYLALGDMKTNDGTAAPLGSHSSSLVTGYQDAHRQLESYLCDVYQFQACLLFTSGFSANTSVLKGLMNQPHCEIFQDKLNHASLIDGGLQAKATNTRFNHNDLNHLQRRLEKSKAKHKLIVSEGVFSMDGDRAPLVELKHIAQQHGAWLMIDDAHGVGVFGEQGEGSCEQVKPDILILPFGKAVASSGAAVLCSDAVAEYLVQFNRDYTYSTAISPLIAKQTLNHFMALAKAHEARAKLQHNIAYFKQLATKHQLAVMPSNSPIQPIVLGDSETVLKVSKALKARGIWLTAIRPPTVAHNTARLRITLTAAHTQTDMDDLVKQLTELL